MSNILIGTSGYSYKDWVGPVYPAGTAAKDYLKFYAKDFLFTELNFSYYRQPDPRTLERLAHVTDDRFRFAVKTHQSLTHEITADFRKQALLFKEGIAPLIEVSKLAAVIAQFPFSYHYNPDNRKHLQTMCEEFAGIPFAVEFRNAEWMRDSVYEGLRKRNVALVNVDEPDLPGLMRPTAVVTSHIAYVRFHGRNSATWWNGDNASRYDYLYTGDELAAWAGRIRSMANQASTVLVVFNNHWRGQAVKNAKQMREMVEQDNGD